MSFEDKIIANSKIKQAKLMRPAKIASKKPDNGVTIVNKSAYFVIRDCADVTQKYLTLLCYGSYADPIADLRGKFVERDIIDFVSRSQADENAHLRHLLYVIFTDVARKEGLYNKTTPPEPVKLDLSEDTDDIYGDYDYVDDTDQPEQSLDITLVDIDITDGKAVIDKLIDVFGATRQKAK